MLKQALKAAGRPFWERLRFRIGAEIDRRTAGTRAETDRYALIVSNLEAEIGGLKTQVGQIGTLKAEIETLQASLENLRHLQASSSSGLEQHIARMIQQRIFVPSFPTADEHASFMQYSTCSVADMAHPRFTEICALIDRQPAYHRKLWEWVYIVHHLIEAGMLTSGKRGVCFGVGREPLPAFFAKMGCDILATDAPPEIGISSGWANSQHYGEALSALSFPEIVSDDILRARVSHGYCDMNAINDDLTGFDFNWSSCCFEHLGSLEAGAQFVINCVEKTLKPGGIAVHTTEFNLSSNEETVGEGPTVIYRKRDIEDLISRLRARGHEVQPFVAAPHAHALDFHIDAPPYMPNPHLKLRLSEYAATSVGLVVRRGH